MCWEFSNLCTITQIDYDFSITKQVSQNHMLYDQGLKQIWFNYLQFCLTG